MNEIQKIEDKSLLALISNGDTSRLNEQEKLAYYKARCEAAGLDPRCQPFQFIKLQGKEVLYALKACTDQLASKHKVATEILSQSTENGIRTVVVRAKAQDGRQTDEVGCVTVESLKGDMLCNAFMKAITKAKRRAVLSLCGLGMLDETELETIPQALPTLEEKMDKDPIHDKSPNTVAAGIKYALKNSSKYGAGKWKEVVLHFGKNKGVKLGELQPHQLRWYRIEWQPKPWKGVINGADQDLRDALDVAHEEHESAKHVQESPVEVDQTNNEFDTAKKGNDLENDDLW